jgi:hypothetical protein
MVSRESATLCSADVSNHVPIDGDHSTIVKFADGTDQGYKNFVQRLKNCVKTASDVVKKRLAKIETGTQYGDQEQLNHDHT